MSTPQKSVEVYRQVCFPPKPNPTHILHQDYEIDQKPDPISEKKRGNMSQI